MTHRKLRIIVLEEAGPNSGHMKLMPRVKQQLHFPSAEGRLICLDSLPTPELASHTEPRFSQLQGDTAPHIQPCTAPPAPALSAQLSAAVSAHSSVLGSTVNATPWGLTVHRGETSPTTQCLQQQLGHLSS